MATLEHKKVNAKPCPFCGCEEILSSLLPSDMIIGMWIEYVECSRCGARIAGCSDLSDSALDSWNRRAYDPTPQRAIAHMKQMEWERDQAVAKLEKAQLIIDLNIGGEMKQEVAEAIATLKAQGVEVAVDPSGAADVYIATVPNGDQYEFLAAGILKLKAEENLTVIGLGESFKKR